MRPKGTIRRLGDSRWFVRVTVKDEQGRRRQPSKTVHGTYSDAVAMRDMLLGLGDRGCATWREFWADTVEPAFAGLSENTVSEYRRLWARELEPRIGAKRVSEMDWTAANGLIGSIGNATVQRSAARLLRKMCNMAIRDRRHMLVSNPVDRAIRYLPYRRKRKELVPVEDVPAFMAQIRGLKYEPLILLELGAGLRPEEARALTWEDIRPYELRGATYCAVEVDKALICVHGRKILKPTKTEASERTAVCGEPFASRVLALAEGKTGPLCPSGRRGDARNPASAYTSPETVAHNWRVWCGKHGVRHVTDENMRSSYATMMGEAMAPDSVVAGNMGHSDGTVKGTHYQRVTMRAKCMAANLLAETIDEICAELRERRGIARKMPEQRAPDLRKRKERAVCNQWVAGSIPVAGSMLEQGERNSARVSPSPEIVKNCTSWCKSLSAGQDAEGN